MRCGILLCALVSSVLFASGVQAQVNHGDFGGTGVDFLQVTETTQSVGDASTLWAPPALGAAGDGLQFLPPSFQSSCLSGLAGATSDTTRSLLQMTIAAQEGKVIEQVLLSESGVAALGSFPPFGTADTNATVSLAGTLTVLEATTGPIPPVEIPFSGTFDPADTLALPSSYGTRPWSGSLTVDVAAVVPGATRLELSLDHALGSSCAAGSANAAIQNHAVDGPQVILADAPDPFVTQVDQLQADVYGDGNVSPGDTVRYTVSVDNPGLDLAGLVYAAGPVPNTSLVVGGVTTSQGTVSAGNSPGDTAIEVLIGTLAGGTTVTIEYEVTVADPLDAASIQAGLTSQGLLTGTDFAPVPSDDPDAPGNADPTTTALADLCDGAVPTSGCQVNGSRGACLGTQGDDLIVGTARADVIVGRAGNDALAGLEGQDLLCAGSGNDVVRGGDGDDRIDGGEGDDLLEGEAGADTITGGPGDDEILGGNGRDVLDGGLGSGDEIVGGRAVDTCSDPDGGALLGCGRGCGVGFELAFCLAPLLWLRTRRRGRAA